MSTLFLAHPTAFVLVVFVLATLAHAAVAHVARAAANVASEALYRRSSIASLRTELHDKQDAAFDAREMAERREVIAARLLAAWTAPFRDNNGDVHHDAIDAVLVAKAYGEADLIIGASTMTPAEIVEALQLPEPPTFAELATRLEAEQRASGTYQERQVS